MQSLLDSLQAGAGVLAAVALLVAIVALIVALARRRSGSAAGAAPYRVDDPILDQLLASQMQRLDGVADELMAQGARIRADGRRGAARGPARRPRALTTRSRTPAATRASRSRCSMRTPTASCSPASIRAMRHACTCAPSWPAAVTRPLSAEEVEALRQAGVTSAAEASHRRDGRATVGGTAMAEHGRMIAATSRSD